MMATPQRRWLIESVEAFLLPELERRGFERIPLNREESRSEVRTGFPFGRLRRTGPSGLELVEIQLDKNRAPVFRINLGIAPAGGIGHELVGRIAQEDVWVHYLDHQYVMYQVRRLRKWFSVCSWPWSKVSEADYQNLVRNVATLLPEIEALFGHGKLGAHMREVHLW